MENLAIFGSFKKKKKIANTSKRCFVYYNYYKFYYIGFTN